MKKKSPPYAIIGAVVLGLLAVVFYVQHEKAVQAAAEARVAAERADAERRLAEERNKPAPPTITEVDLTKYRNVLYATQPVAPGTRLSPSFFEVKRTPEGILPDAYTDKDTDSVVGMFAVRTIEKGDALTPRNIGKTLPTMEGRIPPGMRAISLNIFNAEPLNVTGGFVVDGDRVDLLLTLTSLDNFVISTQMVMQNLKVLYVPGPPALRNEQTQGITPNGNTAITFEVTPEQAQALIMISQTQNAKFSMILRSKRDNTQVVIKPFLAEDYAGNFKKIQKTTDTSILRVQELQKQIEAKEALNQGQGNTNATTPTPPSP